MVETDADHLRPDSCPECGWGMSPPEFVREEPNEQRHRDMLSMLDAARQAAVAGKSEWGLVVLGCERTTWTSHISHTPAQHLMLIGMTTEIGVDLSGSMREMRERVYPEDGAAEDAGDDDDDDDDE